MRWFILALNLLAAIVFLLVGTVGGAKSRSFVQIIHREMEARGMIEVHVSESGRETPDVHVELMKVANANYQTGLSLYGVLACLINGLLFLCFCNRPKRESAIDAPASSQRSPGTLQSE